MNSRAQSSLEYLMTYGWALVLIATVVAVLVFIISSPAGDVVFSSSDPGKIMLNAGAVSGSDAEIMLQNTTGGSLQVTDSTASGAFFGAICTLNDLPLPTGSSSTEVAAGGEMDISCSGMAAGTGTLTMQYTDYAGLQRQVVITMGGSGASADPNLVAYYAFSESSGTTASNSTGSNNGSLVDFDCTTAPDCDPNSGWISGGISGNALSFDGTDAYVDIARMQAEIEGQSALTVSAWMKTAVANTNSKPNIVAKWNNGGGNTFKLGYGDGENLIFGVWNESTAVDSAISPANWGLDNEWHHIAGVYDGAEVHVYGDGVALDPTPGTLTGTIRPNTDIGLVRIGSDNSSVPSFWNGQIDEVRIYNRALSVAEICSLCNAFASCSC